MQVELLDYTSGQRRVMGVVSLNAGRIIVQGEVPSVLRNMLDEWQTEYTDPAAFLTALPTRLSGSRLRARLR